MQITAAGAMATEGGGEGAGRGGGMRRDVVCASRRVAALICAQVVL